MAGFHSALTTAATGICALLLAAGCDSATSLSDVADTALSEDAVLDVLGRIVQADTPEMPETDASAGDAAAYFGEAATLYGEVSPEAVEITEEVVTSEADAGGGGPVVHGRLAGRFWNDLPDSNSDESGGIFRGRWFTADGEVRGVLRGEYRPLPPDALPERLAGGGVFRGRFIDLEGRLAGFIHGRYGHAPDGRGLFFGRWLGRERQLVGILKGHWIDEPETDGGRFAGRWAGFNICDEAESLPDIEFEAGDFGGLDTIDTDADVQAPLNDVEPVFEGGARLDAAGRPRPPCVDPNQPFGFLRGWHAPHPPDGDEPPPPGGRFRGRWMSANGEALGRLRGRYEPLEPPASGDDVEADRPARVHGVLYGRYVDSSGELRGFIRGVYGRSVHDVGVFRGHYFDADRQEQGVLLGRWAMRPHRPGGPFAGVWFGTDLDDEDPETGDGE